MHGPIWLVTGVPGAGKTTVSRALAKRYERAIHIEADVLGDWMDAGACANPWTHTAEQRHLGQRSAALIALEHAMAGYAAIIDDTIEDERDGSSYAAFETRRIFLLPTLEVALMRNALRTNKPAGDMPHLEAICLRLYEPMRRAHTPDRGWSVLDTSAMDVSSSVDAVLERYPPSPLEALSFRPLELRDLPLMQRWHGEPHVRAWWRQDPDEHALLAKYGPRIDGTEPTHVFVIEQRTRPIGWIQWYRWRDYPEHAARLGADATSAGIDLAIGAPAMLGLGIGPRAIRAFVDRVVFRDASISACISDPEERNTRSLRAFERAGFVRMARVRDGELDRCVMRRDRS
jgi:RimJ/RimL family protein N-acetyltransferase